MTDQEFDKFVSDSVESLERKQADLSERFGLGSHALWLFDQPTGLLRFYDRENKLCVEAEVTQIGSYSLSSHTWKWAWANPTVVDSQRFKSAKLNGLFDRTGIEIFRKAVFQADDQMPWEIAAMAVEYLGALGCYRGPAKNLEVFLAIEKIRAS
jgi:hypothetical protein